MDISILKENIRKEEGFRPYGYYDSEGWLTIGYGRMIDKRLNGGITTAEAEILLDNDIQKTIAELDHSFPWFKKLISGRQMALVEMCFQMGLTRLKGFKNMLIAMENSDFLEAAKEALNSRWARNYPSRAARVAALIKNGGTT